MSMPVPPMPTPVCPSRYRFANFICDRFPYPPDCLSRIPTTAPGTRRGGMDTPILNKPMARTSVRGQRPTVVVLAVDVSRSKCSAHSICNLLQPAVVVPAVTGAGAGSAAAA